MVVNFSDKGETIKVYLNGYNPPAADSIGSLQKQVTSSRKSQERIRPLEIVNSGLVPGPASGSAMIALFAGACPTGWTEYTAARGLAIVGVPSGGTVEGTVGTPLTNLGTRTISTVVAHVHAVGTLVNAAESSHTHGVGTYNNATEAAHVHSVDPPNTTSAGTNDDHNHTIDPAATTSGAGSAHSHGDGTAFNGYLVADVITPAQQFTTAGSYGIDTINTTETESAHTHSVDIASFLSSGASTITHTHATNIAPFDSAAGSSHDHTLSGSSAAGSSHNHTISGSVASTGSATVDVTMPYIQLRLCQKS
jgi:hypothetical protein